MPGGDYRDELRSRGGWAPRPARSSIPTASGSGSTTGPPATPSASARASGSRWASRATCRGSIPRRTPSCSVGARTSRRARSRSMAARSSPATRRPGAEPTEPGARSAPRSASATGPRSWARPFDRRPRPSPPAAAAGWSRPTRPSGRSRPARRACSTTASACLGGGRIATPAAAPDTAPGEPVAGRSPRVTIGPALPLALLVGLVNTAHLRADPRRRRGSPAPDVHRRRARRLGRSRDRRPDRHRCPRHRRLPADPGHDPGLGGDRHRRRARDARTRSRRRFADGPTTAVGPGQARRAATDGLAGRPLGPPRRRQQPLAQVPRRPRRRGAGRAPRSRAHRCSAADVRGSGRTA